jgi:hypothetical protein
VLILSLVVLLSHQIVDFGLLGDNTLVVVVLMGFLVLVDIG